MTTLRVHFKNPCRSSDHPRVFHVDRVREGKCGQGFVEAISCHFIVLGNLTDPVERWYTLKCEILNAKEESIDDH